MREDLIERLRNFEGSDALGNGDFSLMHEAAAALEAAREDARRLDWLADRDNPIGNVQLPSVCVMNNMHSLRAAIDEAMRLDPELYAAIDQARGKGANDEA